VLWDIRVSAAERGTGIGSALFRAAEDWARARGCGWLKIETQNVNAAACRFYQKMGPPRFYVGAFLFLIMMALPIKMVLRWLFNLKYIVHIQEIFFNV